MIESTSQLGDQGRSIGELLVSIIRRSAIVCRIEPSELCEKWSDELLCEHADHLVYLALPPFRSGFQHRSLQKCNIPCSVPRFHHTANVNSAFFPFLFQFEPLAQMHSVSIDVFVECCAPALLMKTSSSNGHSLT
jgi:hypothetical protein